jgi:hypothetical protein
MDAQGVTDYIGTRKMRRDPNPYSRRRYMRHEREVLKACNPIWPCYDQLHPLGVWPETVNRWSQNDRDDKRW